MRGSACFWEVMILSCAMVYARGVLIEFGELPKMNTNEAVEKLTKRIVEHFQPQQAVEKSLKAVLALYDKSYPRRHDLAELMELVKPLLPELLPYEHEITSMTPFAVDMRYDNEFEPSKDKAVESVEIAMTVHELARVRIEQSNQSR